MLDPQIGAALEALAKAGLPPIESLTPEKARAIMNAMSKKRGGSAAPLAKVEAATAPGPAGPVPLRIYWPEASGPLPCLLYFHGGGFVIGDLDTHDAIARNLCSAAGALLVSVDYRLAPEHRFPAAVEDAWAAFLWLREVARDLGADPGRMAVTGDSAGGSLALDVALLAREAGIGDIKLQALVYPVTDFSLGGASYRRFATGYGVLTEAAMVWFRDHYLGAADDAKDWRASPLLAESLAGLPPAVIVNAECDVLYDDGLRLAEALTAAGTPVVHKVFPGMIHGFFGMAPDIAAASEAQAFVGEALAAALR